MGVQRSYVLCRQNREFKAKENYRAPLILHNSVQYRVIGWQFGWQFRPSARPDCAAACPGFLAGRYANAVSGAFKYGHAVLIETQPDQEEAWFKFVREHLSPEAEINAALVKGRARGPEAAAFSAAARAPEIRTPRRTNPGRS